MSRSKTGKNRGTNMGHLLRLPAVAEPGSGQGYEHVFQAGVERANVQALQAEVGGRAVGFGQDVDGLAEDGRLVDAGPGPEPAEQAGAIRGEDFQPTRP